MTQKELRKLKKTELLEMMIALRNAVEDETAAYRKRIQAESKETKSASPEVPADSQ